MNSTHNNTQKILNIKVQNGGKLQDGDLRMTKKEYGTQAKFHDNFPKYEVTF